MDQVASLQSELDRVRIENQKLRSQHPQLSKRADLERELDQVQKEVAELTKQLGVYQRKASEGESAKETAECQAVEAEVRAGDLQQEIEDLRRAQQRLQTELGEAEQLASELRAASVEQEAELVERTRRLEDEIITAERKIEEVSDMAKQERASWQRDAELSRYRAIEEEQRKWEAREERLVSQLEERRREHSNHEAFVMPDHTENTTEELTKQLEESKQVLASLEEHNESQRLYIQELQAELALQKAKLKRAGTASEIETVSRDTTTPPIETSLTAALPLPTSPVLPHVTIVQPAHVTSVSTTQPSTPSTPTTSVAVQSVVTPVSETVSTALRSSAVPFVPVTDGGQVAASHGSLTSAASAYASQASSLASPTSLLTQLPNIPRFSGEETTDGETFQDWHEQFESVAILGGWSEHGKLVNLTTRLKGAAYSFYRSCAAEHRNSYTQLVVELKKRFTPVQLTAIQTQQFHDRQQGAKETVDEYAQALKKLYKKAYSTVLRGGAEAEKMGQTVLANQFVAGLRSDLKTKVVGTEGNFEQLLVKARFEEAKKKELTAMKEAVPRWKPGGGTSPSTPSRNNQRSGPPGAEGNRPENRGPSRGEPQRPNQDRGNVERWPRRLYCHNCGMSGHLKRDCRYRYPRNDGKAHGRKDHGNEARGRKDPPVANVSRAEDASPINPPKKKIEDIRRELREAELAAAVNDAAGIIRNVEGVSNTLGPTITARVEVNGVSTDALVDTGSPATILSLDFAMEVMTKERNQYSSVDEWKIGTTKKFTPPEVALKNYGGGRLDITAQIMLCITQGDACKVNARVMVKQGAPNSLLLGTDTLPQLGFALVMKRSDTCALDLYSGREVCWQGTAAGAPGEKVTKAGEQAKGASSSGAKGKAKSSDAEESQGRESGVVRLLQATKIPAGCGRMVRAKVEGAPEKHMSLFTACQLDEGLSMPEGAVELMEGTCVTLIVENSSTEPAQLCKGVKLGEVTPVSEVPGEEVSVGTPDAADSEEGSVANLSHEDEPLTERTARLLEKLEMRVDHLTPEQQEQLKDVIVQHADVR